VIPKIWDLSALPFCHFFDMRECVPWHLPNSAAIQLRFVIRLFRFACQIFVPIILFWKALFQKRKMVVHIVTFHSHFLLHLSTTCKISAGTTVFVLSRWFWLRVSGVINQCSFAYTNFLSELPCPNRKKKICWTRCCPG